MTLYFTRSKDENVQDQLLGFAPYVSPRIQSVDGVTNVMPEDLSRDGSVTLSAGIANPDENADELTISGVTAYRLVPGA